MPSLAIAYAVFGIFGAAIELFARPPVAAAVLHGPQLTARLLFTPLVAALSIWIGIAILTRSSDPRRAAQRARQPALLRRRHRHRGRRTPRDRRPVVAIGAALVLLDALGWKIVTPMFNRERFITASR